MFNIVEKFITLSGEAPNSGEPIYLIRFSRCNLNCSYCDTSYNNEINYTFSQKELINEINRKKHEYPGIKILLTGGEPLLEDRQQKIIQLINKTNKINNCQFFIETNGTIEIKDFSLNNVHYVIDWKTPSSGYKDSFITNNLYSARSGIDVIKFVTAYDDLVWVKEKIDFIKKFKPNIAIYLSPQLNNIKLDQLAYFITDNKLSVNLSIQLHKIIWGNDKRGV